ncbi:Transthyretin-like family protein [Dictyocaulus viviparus]|uniref:Transthyretin-like family protein n=1 Tax=Dictyocaulus viviparus TaxID=29172 RepID=A0A0D8XTN9_DICVI|nr:Transthyretin-like family protein [Dictyocaulus viviparus]
MRILLLILFVIHTSTCLFGFIGRQQSVDVTGRLFCNGVPAKRVKVKLYDKDPIFDRKLDQSYTNDHGEFHVTGSAREITRIDPKINIYHKCGYFGPCYKKLPIKIPKSFISYGKRPTKTYDIGAINLANKFKGETIDCIN